MAKISNGDSHFQRPIKTEISFSKRWSKFATPDLKVNGAEWSCFSQVNCHFLFLNKFARQASCDNLEIRERRPSLLCMELLKLCTDHSAPFSSYLRNWACLSRHPYLSSCFLNQTFSPWSFLFHFILNASHLFLSLVLFPSLSIFRSSLCLKTWPLKLDEICSKEK